MSYSSDALAKTKCKANSCLAIFIWGLGEGLEPGLQGLAMFFVEEGYTARMFAIIARLNLIGEMIGGPLMAKLLLIGYKGRFQLEGLAFLVSSVSHVFICNFSPDISVHILIIYYILRFCSLS